MRRTVRYSPLGKGRKVTLHFGLDSQKREGEIVDESMTGYGLALRDASGLSLNQVVVLEGPKGKMQGTVMRLEAKPNGTYQVGIQMSTNRG